jgi:hypothetical protein
VYFAELPIVSRSELSRSFDQGRSVMMRQIGRYWPAAKYWPHRLSSNSGLRP